MPHFPDPATIEGHWYSEGHVEPGLTMQILSMDPMVLRITFPPNGVAAAHSHGHPTVYTIVQGPFFVGGVEVPTGGVFTVKAGEVYGPEGAGPDGAVIIVTSVGGPVSTDWV
jgi:hypothetical protein